MQKQPPEKFCRKTPVLETFFNSEYCKNFYNTYFEEHLRTATTEYVHESEKSKKLLIKDFNST